MGTSPEAIASYINSLITHDMGDIADENVLQGVINDYFVTGRKNGDDSDADSEQLSDDSNIEDLGDDLIGDSESDREEVDDNAQPDQGELIVKLFIIFTLYGGVRRVQLAGVWGRV